MAGRDQPHRSTSGFSLPAFERLAPPPPPDAIGHRIEAHSSAGDIVVDLFGRGGWIARAALERQRRAVSLESTPLTRLLAEVTLRPPDLRHLDAAFQAIASAPSDPSAPPGHAALTVKHALEDLFSSECATCGRTVSLDEVVWDSAPPSGRRVRTPAGANRHDPSIRRGGVPVRKIYRCPICRDQLGGGETRHAPVDEQDRARAGEVDPQSRAWRLMHDRFPVLDGQDGLVDEVLALHTPRQLVALHAILERIDGELRAPAVEASLRLALLHALLPSTRLYSQPGRVANLRIDGAHVRLARIGQWRERNPWLAFDEGFRVVRGFVQRLDALSGAAAGLQARFREDLQGVAETPTSVIVRVGSPIIAAALADQASRPSGANPGPRIGTVLAQALPRPNQDRLSFAYFATGWVLGHNAAAALPLAPLFRETARIGWGWQSRQTEDTLRAAAPLLGRDARAVLLLDEGGAEGLTATALGALGAGYRLGTVRLDEAARGGGVLELIPPGSAVPPAARTRANQSLPPLPGGAGDPDYVPGRGLFAPPERIDARAFSREDVARTVTDTAIEILQSRGEPAGEDRLIGELLVGLDRAGHLRRLLKKLFGEPDGDPNETRELAIGALLGIIRDELARPDHPRLMQLEPGSWWLANNQDVIAAELPLADRVEWAVFSLLSTAGRMSEATIEDRIEGMFTGHDQPDRDVVRAAIDSYRGATSAPDRLATDDDLSRRSEETLELIALLTDLGHRMGLNVWIGRREQARTLRGRRLDSLLDERERDANLTGLARALPADLEQIPCIWYVRHRMTFAFEVEWTAMLGETLLRRHARISPDDRLVRFLVTAPERTDLVRFKLARSTLLRRSLEAGNWHVLKSNHLRAFSELAQPRLEDLEPYLGLDPVAESDRHQMPLFASTGTLEDPERVAEAP